MIKQLCKGISNEFFSPLWLCFIIVAFFYGFLLKISILTESMALNVEINKWDIIISFLNDPYFLIYFIIPIWLIIIVRNIINNYNYLIFSRLFSNGRWILFNCLDIMPKLLVNVLIWILVSFILTIGIPLEINWSKFSDLDQAAIYQVGVLRDYISPLTSIVLQTMALSLFCITLITILSTAFLLIPKYRVLVILGTIFFCFTLISFKIPFDFEWIRIPNYVIISYTYSNFSSFLPIVILELSLITICFYILKFLLKWFR